MPTDIHQKLKAAVEDHLPSLEIDRILNSCEDMECWQCGEILCPHKDRMHFHHDGCPSCAEDR